MRQRKYQGFIITAISGIIFCIVIGLIFYQEKVFFTSHQAFWFISFGIIGSLFFTTLKFFNLRNAIIVFFILAFLNSIIFGNQDTINILSDLLLIGGLALSIYVHYNFFINKYKGMKFTRSILLGLSNAIIFVMITILLLLINLIPQGGVKEVYTNLAFGFLIGFGLGLGFEFAEDIKRKLKI